MMSKGIPDGLQQKKGETYQDLDYETPNVARTEGRFSAPAR